MKYNSDYVQSKREHLVRVGLIGPKKPGIGRNGGVAPDWLVAHQEEEEKQERRYRAEEERRRK